MTKPKAAWHVYTLSDPKTGAVRYVGCTQNLSKRLKGHCSEAKHGGVTLKDRWVVGLLAQSLTPVLTVMESGSDDDWYSAESKWTTHFLDKGCKLTNIHLAKIGP